MSVLLKQWAMGVAGGFSWSSYWTALKAAMVNKPSAAYEVAADTFIRALVDGGVWAKLDRLFVFGAETNDGGEALLDWIHPTGTPAVLAYGAGGSVPAFTANRGFTGNVTNKSLINTQYNTATENGNFTLTSASLGMFDFLSNKAGSGAHQSGTNEVTHLSPNYGGTAFRGTLNVANYQGYPASSTRELCSVVRTGNTLSRYKDAALLGTQSVAPTGLRDQVITILGLASGSYSDNTVMMYYAGGYLDETELGVFAAAWKSFYYSIVEYEPTYTLLSDTDDLYAHESQILIKQIGGVDYLFLLYMSNKISGEEWDVRARAKLKVYNLSTMALVKTEDLFYPGLAAGVTMSNEHVNVPRMYLYGTDYLRCFVASKYTLYTRDVNISDSNPDNWTTGNISIAQMVMKNALGEDTLSDVTSENVRTHLENVLSESNALYNNLMPLFRNMEIAKSGDTWIAVLEMSGERVSVNSNIPIVLKSTNAGGQWAFNSFIGYTTENRTRLLETGVIYIGANLHAVSRSVTNTIFHHFYSEDGGNTWTEGDNIVLDGVLAAKPAAINYTDGTLKNMIAIQLNNRLYGSGRTSMWIGTTADFSTYTQQFQIITEDLCHYPFLHYYNSKMYISYTKGLKGTSKYLDKDSIVFAELV